MDNIEKILNEIVADRNVQKCKYFTSSFLNNVAEVFEKHGFGVTWVFLYDKQNQWGLQDQAKALLYILDIFCRSEDIQQNRSIGRYIIKTLNTIRNGG